MFRPVVHSPRSTLNAGFTLIEIMIVVAMVAILAAIAFPSYSSYIKKSRARSASADLVALSLVVENQFQKTLAYPTTNKTSTADTTSAFAGWAPTQAAYFTYTYTYTAATSSPAAPEKYALTATGTGSTDCTLTFTSPNQRSASGSGCGFSAW